MLLSSIAVLVTKIKSRRFTPHAHLHLVDLASADSTHKTAILGQKAHATIFSIYKHISTSVSSFPPLKLYTELGPSSPPWPQALRPFRAI
jgi:hypothetical protein